MVQQVQITEAPLEILGGSLFAVAGAGESHGPGITTIVFGCPPGLDLSTRAIQPYLNRRRPGGTKHGTPRHEADWVVFLSGIYQDDHDALLAGPEITIGDGETKICAKTYDSGFSTGEPIAALVLSFHAMTMHDGMMHMQKMERVVVPAHGGISFDPGGNHLMLTGLQRMLKAGEYLMITLETSNGESVMIHAEVRDMRSKSNETHTSHGHHGTH